MRIHKTDGRPPIIQAYLLIYLGHLAPIIHVTLFSPSSAYELILEVWNHCLVQLKEALASLCGPSCIDVLNVAELWKGSKEFDCPVVEIEKIPPLSLITYGLVP